MTHWLNQKKRTLALVCASVLLASMAISSCESVNEDFAAAPAPSYDDHFDLPEIPAAVASGLVVAENDRAVIDFSNTQDGYVMARFFRDAGKDVRVLVIVPDGTQYQYRLTPGGEYAVFPLSGGNGEYTFGVWENIEGARYALVVSTTVEVALSDEFAPFLRPNQFVNYNRDSAAVRKAAELTEGIVSSMDIVSAIYNFVITNITYDKELAATVQSGYLPDVDEVLEKGQGICFDYAALMAAMLRSLGVPTRMVFGYTGDEYHAWISVHLEETGWIDNVIFFDGLDWNLMDPTFAASGQSSELMDYIGDSSNYQARFMY